VRRWLIAWCLSLLVANTFAAPQINWGDKARKNEQAALQQSITEDVRMVWEATYVNQVGLGNHQAHKPEQVWQWASERFTGKLASKPLVMKQQERLIARLTVFSESIGSDFMFTIAQSRLDAVHVSYRYDGGAWTTLSAGDTLPMASWPQPDRQPSFNLPLIAGQMDLVIEFAHRGILDAPVLLQNNRAFMNERAWSMWSAGVAVGVNIVLALMGLMLALNFQRVSFLSISVMSTMMALVLMFNSGLGGMFVGVNYARFNDEAKFVLMTLWSVMLPWVVGLALGIRAYSRAWWWVSVMSLAAGIALAFVWADYSMRDTAPLGIPVLLIVLVLISAAMMGWAWLKAYSRNVLIVMGLSLYLLTLLLPFAGYMGMVSADTAKIWTAALSLIASLTLMRGLFLQHRLGRLVLARAKTSALRDVLTGLLNREGLQAHLYRLRSRIQNENTCAVFIYIQLIPEREAADMYGQDGFEMGMVQVAASLSSSISSVDSLARISRHAFATTVMMPPDPALATRVAQKILSRLMVLASHGTPMAAHVRLALSWLPLYGFRVDSLEQRSLRALIELGETKRIGWVGGSGSHAQAEQMLKDTRLAYSTPSGLPTEQDANTEAAKNGAVTSTLYDRIHRIEREMLHGVDTRFLVAEAERMSREINEANSQASNSQNPLDDYEPTEFATRRDIKPA
jgi:GGDEF domain-containing protein